MADLILVRCEDTRVISGAHCFGAAAVGAAVACAESRQAALHHDQRTSVWGRHRSDGAAQPSGYPGLEPLQSHLQLHLGCGSAHAGRLPGYLHPLRDERGLRSTHRASRAFIPLLAAAALPLLR